MVVRQQAAPSNFLVTSGPGAVLDYDAAVAKARALFQIVAPDRSAEEFLPPAPNPEDIYVEEVEPPAAAAATPMQEDGPEVGAEAPEMAAPMREEVPEDAPMAQAPEETPPLSPDVIVGQNLPPPPVVSPDEVRMDVDVEPPGELGARGLEN